MYANFSGLNDVSIGAAGLMGIAVKENFNRPYFSQSVTEMYTRWHMTLSEWMRDIVFFPLAAFLMRRATWLTRYQSSAVATMTVFILFGVWHSGASLGWQYWLMGFLLGAAVVVEFYLGQWVRQWPDAERFALPPMVARVARTLYANLYFAMAASLIEPADCNFRLTATSWISELFWIEAAERERLGRQSIAGNQKLS